MTNALSKSDIKRACDILRMDDGVGPSAYVEQLSWLLFLRVFELVEQQLEDLSKEDRKSYTPIIEPEYRWSTWAKKDWKYKDELVTFINQKLFPYLKTLGGTPEKQKIAELFLEFTNRIHNPQTILNVADILNPIDMDLYQDSHLLSQVYEEILQEMGTEGGWSGEFYTPRPIIRFMVDVVNPKLGETVLDPFAGSCGFLIESFRHIYEPLESSIGVNEWDKLQKNTFYGQEKKPLPFLIGNMNMILHKILVPNITRTNTLMEDVHNIPDSSKYDVILTNPPFGGKEDRSVQNNYPIQASATEALALQYVMRKLKNGGRCGIVLPEGQILFGGGVFAEIRKELLTKFNVTAIISLPQGTFTQMGAGIKTCLVFFEKTGPTKKIWFGELSGKFTKKSVISNSHFSDLYKKYLNQEISENSWTEDIDSIKERGFELTAKNPSNQGVIDKKNMKTLMEEGTKLMREINEYWNNLEFEINESSKKQKNILWKKIPLEDLSIKITDGTHKTPKYVPEGVPFISTVNLVPFSDSFDYSSYKKFITEEEHKELTKRTKPEKGDLLVSKCGTIGRTQLVRVDYDFSIFVGLLLIKLNKDLVMPEFIEYQLNTVNCRNLMDKLSTGATRATLPIGAMYKFPIWVPFVDDKPDKDTQNEIVNSMHTLLSKLRVIKESLNNNISIINSLSDILFYEINNLDE